MGRQVRHLNRHGLTIKHTNFSLREGDFDLVGDKCLVDRLIGGVSNLIMLGCGCPEAHAKIDAAVTEIINADDGS